MIIVRLPQYQEWFLGLPIKIQTQIEGRLVRVRAETHFGHHKQLTAELWELKFGNGNRIYYTIVKVGPETMLLILGGNKNGQEKDIKKAARFARWAHGKDD